MTKLCVQHLGFTFLAHPVGQLSLPSLLGKSSTRLLAGVKVGRVHLCRVAGNTVITVIPYGRWRPVANGRSSSRRWLYSVFTLTLNRHQFWRNLFPSDKKIPIFSLGINPTTSCRVSYNQPVMNWSLSVETCVRLHCWNWLNLVLVGWASAWQA